MSDYIKREDAKRAIRRNFHDIETRCMINNIINEVAKVSSNNLVEVVRCKDCKYRAEFSSKCNKLNLTPMWPNDYCSYGERADT